MTEGVPTNDGCLFNDLCEGGIISYCCDNLVDIRELTQLKHAKNKVADKIKDIIISLQIHRRGKRVAKIYIGKTGFDCKETQEDQDQKLDPMNYKTWNLKGIKNRWKGNRSKNKENCKDGMIVLAAVTKEAIPLRCRDRITKEDYAFAIEQALLHHFVITTADPRVVNQNFHTGGINGDRSAAAYAIYMTFTFEERAQQEPAQQEPTPRNQSPTPPPPQTKPNSAKKGVRHPCQKQMPHLQCHHS